MTKNDKLTTRSQGSLEITENTEERSEFISPLCSLWALANPVSGWLKNESNRFILIHLMQWSQRYNDKIFMRLCRFLLTSIVETIA